LGLSYLMLSGHPALTAIYRMFFNLSLFLRSLETSSICWEKVSSITGVTLEFAEGCAILWRSMSSGPQVLSTVGQEAGYLQKKFRTTQR